MNPATVIVERGCPQNFLDIAELRGRNITEDLMRRDFTVNAMGMKILPGGNMGGINRSPQRHGRHSKKNYP